MRSFISCGSIKKGDKAFCSALYVLLEYPLRKGKRVELTLLERVRDSARYRGHGLHYVASCFDECKRRLAGLDRKSGGSSGRDLGCRKFVRREKEDGCARALST